MHAKPSAGELQHLLLAPSSPLQQVFDQLRVACERGIVQGRRAPVIVLLQLTSLDLDLSTTKTFKPPLTPARLVEVAPYSSEGHKYQVLNTFEVAVTHSRKDVIFAQDAWHSSLYNATVQHMTSAKFDPDG